MPSDSPTSDLAEIDASAVCSTCGHPDSAHDKISRRWCAVSAASGGTRACICSGDVQAARTLSHY